MKFDKTKGQSETFAEALMGEATWLPEPHAKPVASSTLTEKAVVLESFTRFAEEKIAESATQEINFEGGSLVLKQKAEDQLFSPQHSSQQSWMGEFEKRLTADVFQALVFSKKTVKVLFYVDELKSEHPTKEAAVSREFLYCFESEVAELFEKMVRAMKLQSQEFAISIVTLNGSTRTLQDLTEEIYFRQPDIVVPLGALATQALLGSKERLASVHGKFYPLSTIETKKVHVVPLFHPNVIATNLNMKKSTWADMQKIMQALGII